MAKGVTSTKFCNGSSRDQTCRLGNPRRGYANESGYEQYELGDNRPVWRTKDLSGYISSWDGEWFYHFQDGGYGSIEWVELRVVTPEQAAAVEKALRRIHVPGHRIEQGFRVYGYARDGATVGYI
jgi:hypothetical protein